MQKGNELIIEEYSRNNVQGGSFTMKTTFKPSDKIGDIVAQVPNAVEVLRRYNIDYCCGGHRPLSVAIAEQQLDEQAVLQELELAFRQSRDMRADQVDWRTAPLSDLIDHILHAHHAFLQATLPALSELTTAILRAHGVNHPELRRVHKLFHTLKMEMEQHLIKEEEQLYPAVKRYEQTGAREHLKDAAEIMAELEDEHDTAGSILKELRSITKDNAVPPDGCRSYEKAYAMIEELEANTFQHIHLENNILHPRVRQEMEGFKTV